MHAVNNKLHDVACINVVVVEEVADFVVAALGHRKRAEALRHVVAVAPVVVALLVLRRRVLEVLVRRREIQRRVRVRPELRPLPRPPNRLQHLVPVHVPRHRHLLHLQLHLHRVHSYIPAIYFNNNKNNFSLLIKGIIISTIYN